MAALCREHVGHAGKCAETYVGFNESEVLQCRADRAFCRAARVLALFSLVRMQTRSCCFILFSHTNRRDSHGLSAAYTHEHEAK
ncbi:hypothetical protein F2P81_012349 [Scophthalmus maximus]|uniref:Uncharacterized protein n=1 Tax=Scophthalmus maximus TaxID=52904 RepID=A0A6A4SU72_SCOMX|nr:hypothetical protein F2P81_012349 [Scophthalmus maximus]